MKLSTINQFFGNIDLQLLDLVLQNTFHHRMKVLDVGCGEGRNLMYFLREKFFVCGVDKDPTAIQVIQFLAGSMRPDLDKDNFQVADITKLPYSQDSFHLIIASAVLHFANNHEHFLVMISELVRCLKTGGILYLKMDSNIGLEDQIATDKQGVYHADHGSARFLLTRNLLDQLQSRYSMIFLKPWKVEILEGIRSTATLVLTIK